MYCKHCGKELSEDAFMCPACGAPVGQTLMHCPQATQGAASGMDPLLRA